MMLSTEATCDIFEYVDSRIYIYRYVSRAS